MSNITINDRDDGVRLIVIDRSDKMNALTSAMYEAMREALEGADAAEAIHAVVFAGQPGMFSAGNDLADFIEATRVSFLNAPALRFIRQLARTRTPMVAAVGGVAIGIGATLTLHCDLVYASEAARFRMPFVELGLVPEAASSFLLPRRVGLARASELLLLSEGFDAEAAVRLGLVNAVVPADLLVEHALAQAARFGRLPRAALEATRRLIRGDLETVQAALEAEAEEFDRRLRSPQAQAAIQRFLERTREAGR